MHRRIGSTNYKVNIHFSNTARDTLHDKILHLIQNEVVTNTAACGIISEKRRETLVLQGVPAFCVTNLLSIQY